MTEIERKVVKRAAELSPEDCYRVPPRHFAHRALWNALYCAVEELEAEKAARAADREQHEVFRQQVSDAVEAALSTLDQLVLDDRAEAAVRGIRLVTARFILPKPDPIAEAWIEATGNTVGMEPLNAALAARGLKIVEDK